MGSPIPLSSQVFLCGGKFLIVWLRCQVRVDRRITLSSFPKCPAMESGETTLSLALASKGSIMFSRAAKGNVMRSSINVLAKD